MMKRIFAATLLLMVMAAGFLVAVGSAEAARRTTVSRTQYRILFHQCRYANTKKLRRQCRLAVGRNYRIGRWNPYLDCRTYSGITVCGKLKLSKAERRCVIISMKDGLSRRRAEVECYAFA
ncbi:hypothetical protein AB0O34_00120 [Sphaerisporangium sp. NPDC088356]|uniref:hypothetical protein n=1 Tax=Sphaerisporangium sp. NPDC088356 TaxID=3154871 RepID=UPI0034412A4D